jgi:hypothetical protein
LLFNRRARGADLGESFGNIAFSRHNGAEADGLTAPVPLARRRIFRTAAIFPLKMVWFRRIEGYAKKITQTA